MAPGCGRQACVLIAWLATAVAAGAKRTAALVGAAGGIGQPLALLLRLSVLVDDLRLYDVNAGIAAGLASDLQHIDVLGAVTAYAELSDCLVDAQTVVIAAGVARGPGMSSEERFDINAAIVRKVAEACVEHCPEAVLVVATEPVASMVPLVYEVLRRSGVRKAEERILGATMTDGMRANTFLAERVGCEVEPRLLKVPVIGGHGETALPLFSRVEVSEQLSAEDVSALTRRVQTSADEVVSATRGAGGAVHAVAVGVSRLVDAVQGAREGQPNVLVYALVRRGARAQPLFMTCPVLLGRRGIAKLLPSGSLSGAEQRAFELLLPALVLAARRGREVVVPPPRERRGGGAGGGALIRGRCYTDAPGTVDEQ